MAGHVKAIPGELQGYGGLLERNAGYFTEIERYSERTASDTSGFTGVMAALIPVVEGVTALYGETLQLADSRLRNVQDELGRTATEYEERERQLVQLLNTVERGLSGMRV